MSIEQKRTNRISPIFTIMLLLMMICPAIAFHYYGMDFNKFIHENNLHSFALVDEIQDYVRDVILQWTALSLAAITILLSLTQYRITKNKSLLLIGGVQIIMTFFLIFSPPAFNESASNTIYFIKLTLDFTPFFWLIVHAISSYNRMIEEQALLQVNQDKLQYIAAHDGLTGLYNRRKFEDFLNDAIINSKKNNDFFALFILDIDNLKSINDAFGHIQGDNVIKKFASELALLIRQGDTFSRIGGDEFALITPKLSSPAFARKLAERMIKGMNLSSHINEMQSTTASIGISVYPLDGETADELLKKADLAMYKAKKSGKNDYRFYTEKSNPPIHAEEFST